MIMKVKTVLKDSLSNTLKRHSVRRKCISFIHTSFALGKLGVFAYHPISSFLEAIMKVFMVLTALVAVASAQYDYTGPQRQNGGGARPVYATTTKGIPRIPATASTTSSTAIASTSSTTSTISATRGLHTTDL
ncbi:hypothetical protein Ocin01_18894 [Orchesella cincta]|uniref:Uncharacterized protein n=1 Tax=Orchesella cincta TaxID=48709 RepID=A0A1D2M493_ORCCI|nr:hypothetical protein Ocin01_18894 [Orchesella cincta]